MPHKIYKANGKYHKYDIGYHEEIDSLKDRIGNHVGNLFEKPYEHVDSVFGDVREFHDDGGYNAFITKCGSPFIFAFLIGMVATEFSVRLASLPFAAPYEGIKQAHYHHEAKKYGPDSKTASVKSRCCFFRKKQPIKTDHIIESVERPSPKM